MNSMETIMGRWIEKRVSHMIENPSPLAGRPELRKTPSRCFSRSPKYSVDRRRGSERAHIGRSRPARALAALALEQRFVLAPVVLGDRAGRGQQPGRELLQRAAL